MDKAKIDTIWSDGLTPADYFSSLKNYRHMVLELVADAKVAPADRDRLAEVVQRTAPDGTGGANLRVVILTEDWCGDSATTLPYITNLFASVGVEVRVFRQSVFSALKKWYEEDGTDHIPVVSVLSGAAPPQELYRWVERPQAAHRKVEEWLKEHPRMPELRRKKDDDKAAEKEYFNLYAALLRDMASWYRDGLWSAIAEEFIQGIEEGLSV
jgi:hypothetical protein